MRWLKWLGFILGGLVGLLLLGIGIVYLITGIRLRKKYPVPATPITVVTDSVSLARGKHLATALGKCVGCHEEDLGGRIMGDNPVFGRLVASNLTPGRGGALARYDDAALARAIRHGLRVDSTPLVFMLSEAYQAMADADVAALIAYLRALPPVDRELPGTKVGPMARIIYLTGGLPLIPAQQIDHSARPPATVEEDSTAPYGKYLVELGGCTGCHGPGLSGGGLGPGAKPAANLTPAGIGSWTEADFVRALREGIRPGGTIIDSTEMPWPLAGRMTDAEIHAVWLYLRSVPPKPFGNR